MSVYRLQVPLALLLFAVTLAAAPPIAGSWDLSTVDPDGNPVRATLSMKEAAGKLSGTLIVEDMLLGLSDAAMDGDIFTCKVTYEERVFQVRVKVAGDSLEGAWESVGGRKGAIKGQRSKS